MTHPPLHVVMFHAFHSTDRQVESMIRMAGESALAHYPEAKIVLISNAAGAEADLPAWVSLQTETIDLERVMFERIRLYADYLDRFAFDGHVVFLDTDMLIVRPFDELLDGRADLTVTVRRQSEMPINGGFYVVDTRRRAAVLSFFRRFVDTYRELPAEAFAWNGDQLAIARLLPVPAGRADRSVIVEACGVLVRFATVRRFNHTPRPLMLRLLIFRPSARVLHFKGPRKRWMHRYSRVYLARPFVFLARQLRRAAAKRASSQ